MPIVIRLLGAALPFVPRAAAGTNHGAHRAAANAIAVSRKKALRDSLGGWLLMPFHPVSLAAFL